MNGEAGETDPTSSAVSSQSRDELSALSPKTSIDLRQIFSRFEAFNFDDDHPFQAGLAKITSQASGEKGREQAVDLLKIKLFYYSKHVEPLDVAAYMKWKKTRESQLCMAGDGCTRGGDSCHQQASQSKDQDRGSHPPCDAGDGCTRREDSSDQQASQSKDQDRGSHPPCDAKGKAKDKVCESFNHVRCEDPETGGDCQPHDDAQSEGSQTGSGQFSPKSASHPPETAVTTVMVDSTNTTATSVAEDPGDKETNQCDTGVTPTGTGTTCADVDLNQDIKQTGHVAQIQARREDNQSDLGVCGSDRVVEWPVDQDGGRELSFAEIAELIQSGGAIPGLAQVEVTPTHMAPSPAQLLRPRKPWEE